MAWFVMDLDGTLVTKDMDPTTEQEVTSPVDGAVEAMIQLESEGHRLTVYTSRFAPMPEAKRQQVKQEIQAELAGFGFPEMEVWAGTTKPSGDVFIGDSNVTFDGDWGLALAQSQSMLEERGLSEVQPDDGTMPENYAPEGQEGPQ